MIIPTLKIKVFKGIGISISSPVLRGEMLYSQNGACYVTICTINHDCILSTINRQTNVGADLASAHLASAQNAHDQNNNIINLTTAGNFVKNNWLDIPNRYKHVFLDEYVIIPNHIHGIVIITAKLWQRNYYEHIIRGENELNRIRKYIRENPYRWIDDKENPHN